MPKVENARRYHGRSGKVVERIEPHHLCDAVQRDDEAGCGGRAQYRHHLAGTPKNLQGNERENAIRDGGDKPVESSMDTEERTVGGR